eukprot:CAMPEP_0116870790 /NCGR_PEP_ID=MMETSP0463-20121206/865_1 /TAXON_ID=181622 /ORGANISM="Strombidinopsis sp, Strain SopsisLIS2011" /LENGTH=79 /DNA_ID=CAMNT_0004508013 /DNA_START=104 /DNA_END=343 /DNA_ORIENTATION=+
MTILEQTLPFRNYRMVKTLAYMDKFKKSVKGFSHSLLQKQIEQGLDYNEVHQLQIVLDVLEPSEKLNLLLSDLQLYRDL